MQAIRLADRGPHLSGWANGPSLLARIAMAATLCVAFAGAARAAVIVYVNVPPNTTTEDPLSASDSAGLGSASANLPSGVFAASTTSAPGASDDAAAGIRLYPTGALRFTNPGPEPVVIGAGDISARVRGTYILEFVSAQFGGASTAQCQARLSAHANAVTHTVRATHQVTKTWNGSGELIGSTNVFTPTPGNGTIVPIDTSLESLDMYLSLPGFTLAAGATLDLWFQVYSQSGTTVGEGASSCNGELSFWLDPGVALSNDAGVPLLWVAPPPAVPALGRSARALLFAGLIVAAFFARHGRVTASDLPVG